MHLGSNLFMIEVADDPLQRKFEINHEPMSDTSNTNGYRITITVDLNYTNAIEIKNDGVKLHYSTNGIYYEVIKMVPNNEPNGYETVIPGQDTGTNIYYYFTVTDLKDHHTHLPKYSPNNIYSFKIIPGQMSVSMSLLLSGVFFIILVLLFIGIKTGRVKLSSFRFKIVRNNK